MYGQIFGHSECNIPFLKVVHVFMKKEVLYRAHACHDFYFHLEQVVTGIYICPYSFLASGNFCCQLITFANSLDPDQDRHNVGPGLDPNLLTLS